MYRVLKPGGKGLIIDMNKNTTRAERKAAVDAMELTGLNHTFMMFSFATFLRQGAYTKEGFEKLLEESPFQKRNVEARGLDLRVSLEK
jgi:ubiquinone/menaquinone biosynthesis C-methylase UbiE